MLYYQCVDGVIVMTMLASWVGIDPHGISSAYIVTDSRFTWNLGDHLHFDYGKKVFATLTYPEIFGYIGDVLFPSIALSQLISMIDSGVIFNNAISCKIKSKIVFDFLRNELKNYPEVCINDSLEIIHISRDTVVSGYPEFHEFHYIWSKNSGWNKYEKPMPKVSSLLYVGGSGKVEFESNYHKYQNGNNSNTSRNVFHCFVDTLSNTNDICCGGAPQLVGIYRKPNSYAKNFGIIYNKQKYFLGSIVTGNSQYSSIEWRNELFEIVDNQTMAIVPGAQRQPNILRKF